MNPLDVRIDVIHRILFGWCDDKDVVHEYSTREKAEKELNLWQWAQYRNPSQDGHWGIMSSCEEGEWFVSKHGCHEYLTTNGKLINSLVDTPTYFNSYAAAKAVLEEYLASQKHNLRSGDLFCRGDHDGNAPKIVIQVGLNKWGIWTPLGAYRFDTKAEIERCIGGWHYVGNIFDGIKPQSAAPLDR